MKRASVFLAMITLLALLASIPTQALATSASTLDGMLSDLASTKTTGQASGLQAMKAAVAQYLDSQGFSYSYDDSRDCFTYAMALDSGLGRCDVGIFIFEDGFEVFAYSPIRPKKADPVQLAAAAEFLTSANYNLYLGNFEMDYSDGEVRYKTSVKCFEQIPLQVEIEWLVDIPPIMLDKYGDGLINVLLTGADPAEEIIKIEQ